MSFGKAQPQVSVSVVIPCYRSTRTLRELVNRLTVTLPAAADRYEVILVVDGSPDGTWDLAREIAESTAGIRAVRLSRNYGQHNAIVAGARLARYDIVVTMDDDLQHPPEEIPALLGALTDDVDLVYGVPRDEEHGLARSFASRLVKAGMATTMGVGNARVVGAFRAFRTVLRDGFDRLTGPNASVDVALSWATTQVTSVSIQMNRRTDGRSGYTLRGLLRHTVNMVVGFSAAPLRLVTYLGFAIGTGALVLFTRLLWMYFEGATTVAGFTTVAAMVALFASAQMIAIGVLGEYVGRIHAGGMGRPTYVIRERAEVAQASVRPQPRPSVDAQIS